LDGIANRMALPASPTMYTWLSLHHNYPRAVAAAAHLAGQWPVVRRVAAGPGSCQRIGDTLGRVGNATEDVVVPAVGVVICDDDRGARPVRGLLQGGDLLDQELLLVDRVGVEGVSVMVGGSLDEALTAGSRFGLSWPAAMPPTI
jgi:hypothetical protein